MQAKEKLSLEERMTPEERDVYERYKKVVGKQFVLQEVLPVRPQQFNKGKYIAGYDEDVTWKGIMRWALANDDYSPLWFDQDFASKTRWGGIIAPPLFLLAIDNGVTPVAWLASILYGKDSVINTKDYPNFVGAFQGNTEYEFFEPVRPGDTLKAVATCTDVYWKQGRQYRLMFTEAVTTFTNQKGQKVALCRQGAVYRFK